MNKPLYDDQLTSSIRCHRRLHRMDLLKPQQLSAIRHKNKTEKKRNKCSICKIPLNLMKKEQQKAIAIVLLVSFPVPLLP